MADDHHDQDKPLLHTTDKVLLAASMGFADTVPVTPKLLESMRTALEARYAEIREHFPKLVADCPYDTKLAIAAWVFQAIVAHAREGGTFRHLIYGRLGFEPDAYVPLYEAGGMTISNEFQLSPEAEKE
jgi:hypothetical protein